MQGPRTFSKGSTPVMLRFSKSSMLERVMLTFVVCVLSVTVACHFIAADAWLFSWPSLLGGTADEKEVSRGADARLALTSSAHSNGTMDVGSHPAASKDALLRIQADVAQEMDKLWERHETSMNAHPSILSDCWKRAFVAAGGTCVDLYDEVPEHGLRYMAMRLLSCQLEEDERTVDLPCDVRTGICKTVPEFGTPQYNLYIDYLDYMNDFCFHLQSEYLQERSAPILHASLDALKRMAETLLDLNVSSATLQKRSEEMLRWQSESLETVRDSLTSVAEVREQVRSVAAEQTRTLQDVQDVHGAMSHVLIDLATHTAEMIDVAAITMQGFTALVQSDIATANKALSAIEQGLQTIWFFSVEAPVNTILRYALLTGVVLTSTSHAEAASSRMPALCIMCGFMALQSTLMRWLATLPVLSDGYVSEEAYFCAVAAICLMAIIRTKRPCDPLVMLEREMVLEELRHAMSPYCEALRFLQRVREWSANAAARCAEDAASATTGEGNIVGGGGAPALDCESDAAVSDTASRSAEEKPDSVSFHKTPPARRAASVKRSRTRRLKREAE